jgi:ATP-dependent DNA helicase RecG
MRVEYDTLLALFRGDESDRVERKAEFVKEKVMGNICAFANDLPNHQQPGVIFIGVNKDGTCADLPAIAELSDTIANSCRDAQLVPFPTVYISVHTFDGCAVIVIEVAPYDMPPVYYQGKIYVRFGATLRQAMREEERKLLDKRRYRTFDERPIRAATLDELDIGYLRDIYLPLAVDRQALLDNDRPLEQQLTALGLLNQQMPTLPAILLSAHSPRLFFPGAYIQFLRIDGVEITDPILDQEEIDGRLEDMMRRAFDKIAAYNTVPLLLSDDGARMLPAPDYPVAALREALANAITHRDYEMTNSPVRFYWYHDRVEIISPGGPYGQVTEDNFGSENAFDHRNRRLAAVMKHLGYVEIFGRGIPLIRRALRDNHNPEPEFIVRSVSAGNYVQVVLKKRKTP